MIDFSWVSARMLCFPETLNFLLVLGVFGCWVDGGFFFGGVVGVVALGGRL